MADQNEPLISIVIPTLNEELTISEFIDWCWEGIRKAGVTGQGPVKSRSMELTDLVVLVMTNIKR